MEKFGIFELLDALSALTAPDPAHDVQKSEPKTENTVSPRAEDAAFSPPVYGGYTPERPAVKAPQPSDPQTPVREQDALSSLLSRQEEISRRIDKRR